MEFKTEREESQIEIFESMLLLNNLDEYSKYIYQIPNTKEDEDFDFKTTEQHLINTKKKSGIYYYPVNADFTSTTNMDFKAFEAISVNDIVADVLIDNTEEVKVEIIGYTTLRKAKLHGKVKKTGVLYSGKQKRISDIYNSPYGIIKGLIPVVEINNSATEGSIKEKYLIYFENRIGINGFFARLLPFTIIIISIIDILKYFFH